MRIAVISDIHVLSPNERELNKAAERELGGTSSRLSRRWRLGIHRIRKRFWHGHHESREECFLKAVDEVRAFDPDLVVANGDYGGDTAGTGLSDIHTFESAAGVVQLIRETFGGRCRFIFGDHDLGKYASTHRRGGIRLDSLYKGEQELGIKSFWHETTENFHLIGVNSSLLNLDLFLPEALEHEIPAWKLHKESHLEEVNKGFSSIPHDERIILFCHDPCALSVLADLPAVKARIGSIERTILGHLHAPILLKLVQAAPRPPTKWVPKYPIVRNVLNGMQGAKKWWPFHPIVCPSTFGTGHHFSGGVLLLESDNGAGVSIHKRRIKG